MFGKWGALRGKGVILGKSFILEKNKGYNVSLNTYSLFCFLHLDLMVSDVMHPVWQPSCTCEAINSGQKAKTPKMVEQKNCDDLGP